MRLLDKKLIDLIQSAKYKLSQKEDGPIYGFIGEKNSTVLKSVSNTNPYYEFLSNFDGARFGTIDLWSYNELLKKQFIIEGFVEKQYDWLVIGRINDDPLFMNKKSGEIFLYDLYKMEVFEELGDLSNFLTHYGFGDGYKKFILNVSNNEWYKFIKELR